MAEDAPKNSPDTAASEALVQSLRRELVKSQLIVLELNDRVLQKETDKADAVALLGQAELVLEQKINHLMELDRVLNLRIRELESENETGRQTQATGEAELAKARSELATRVSEVQDLVAKLDQANRELGDTHALAGRLTVDLNAAENRADSLVAEQETIRAEHQRLLESSQSLASELVVAREEFADANRQLDRRRDEIEQLEQSLASARSEIELLRSSWPWRGTAWLRRFFGPKV